MECGATGGACVVACDARPPRLLFSCLALLLSSHRDLPCKRNNPIYVALANKNTPAINWFIVEIIV